MKRRPPTCCHARSHEMHQEVRAARRIDKAYLGGRFRTGFHVTPHCVPYRRCLGFNHVDEQVGSVVRLDLTGQDVGAAPGFDHFYQRHIVPPRALLTFLSMSLLLRFLQRHLISTLAISYAPTVRTIFDTIGSQTCCLIDCRLESCVMLVPSASQLALRTALLLALALMSQALRLTRPSAVHTTMRAPLQMDFPQTFFVPVPRSLLVKSLLITLRGRGHTNNIDTGVQM
jgi:hypothetical protein